MSYPWKKYALSKHLPSLSTAQSSMTKLKPSPVLKNLIVQKGTRLEAKLQITVKRAVLPVPAAMIEISVKSSGISPHDLRIESIAVRLSLEVNSQSVCG
ncbi:hypothetical protein DY000_02038735 [Brassica cretica]|uniref:Uncharacterized protein n=1 Tax=Brassica cretica TaxID=69181 RepID=A0ABQ7B8P1_BRACR|nr:hypothetical protein DY000_02038735 [Brassica cretica]